MEQQKKLEKRWYTDPQIDLTTMFRDPGFFNGGAIAPLQVQQTWASDNPPALEPLGVRWLTKAEGGVYCR